MGPFGTNIQLFSHQTNSHKMVLKFEGFHQELNLQLKKLCPTTEEIVLECNDHSPVEIIQALESTGG